MYSIQWKISEQLCFSGQALVAQNSWMIKNISIQWKFSEQTLFSGQAQIVKNRECKCTFNTAGFFKGVLWTGFGSLENQIGSLESEKIIIGALKSEKIGSLQIHTGYLTFSLKKPWIQWKISGQLCFFRASASCSKSLNKVLMYLICNTVKSFRATLFFRTSASCSKILNDTKKFQYSEKFQGKLCFQGNANC